MRDWIVVGNGFGILLEGTYLRWIYWAPGTQTQEGILRWGEATCGVVPWREGGPRHMHRWDDEVVDDLLDAGIIDVLKAELGARQYATQA